MRNNICCIIIIYVLFSGCLSAQAELDSLFRQAMILYNSRQYFDAVTEFKRVVFFDENSKYEQAANRYIAGSYKAGGRYDEAIFYLSKNIKKAPAREVFILKCEIVRNNILRGSTGQALIQLEQLASAEAQDSGSYNDPFVLYESYFGSRVDVTNYWRGWAYMFEGKWREAADAFGRIKTDKMGYGAELKKISQEAAEKKYSVFFARLISYILPGAGQIYSGKYLSGAMSLLWTTSMGYLSVRSFMDDRIFDGIITTGLFFRFHKGNVENAHKFTEKKNTDISNDALLYIQNNFKGLKP